MRSPDAERDQRVLVFAPIGRDGALTYELLHRTGIEASICDSIGQLVAELADGAGAIILTEEAFDHRGFRELPAALDQQAAWSDIPVILFAGTAHTSTSLRTIGLAETLRNVTFIERPIRTAAVVSVVRAAIRARRRQYELRDTLVALHAARAEAEGASRLKDEFLATLSHELRTPLNAILGWTTMLRHRQVDGARITRALEVIERNARAQAKLIEDVLDMARIITGKLRLEIRPVALGSIIEAAVDAIRPAAEAKSITLRVDAGSVPAISGDAMRLQQVLWNLLSNAVKFTPSKGMITVTLRLVNSHAVLAVSDTGAGLPPEFLPYVFDRFRQADQSVTRGHGGLGLGLSIVKHLIELHGGTVGAESAGAGLGATFRLTLPIPVMLEGPPERRERELTADAFALRLDGRTLLVVDDDAATRELLADLFERAGASVVSVDSASAAMSEVCRCAPDAIIADIGMPGEDGFSLMRRIRSLPPPAGRVPAIALSAYTRGEDQDAAHEAGFSTFIAKPATPQQLLQGVDAQVNRAAPPLSDSAPRIA
jgi:signal transduction histidine kinase/ActR/RegA family two-component response regulator